MPQPVAGSALPAFVARLPLDERTRISGVLVPPSMAYLAIRVFFHRVPMSGLTVTFHRRTEDGSAGDQIGSSLETDSSGSAVLDMMVPTGNYLCRIHSQDHPAEVTVVPDPNYPFILVLPFGRPYADISRADSREEFSS